MDDLSLEDMNLYELRLKCSNEVLAKAKEWSEDQASSWQYGTYSSNDFTLFFEKGFLFGYLLKQTSTPVTE